MPAKDDLAVGMVVFIGPTKPPALQLRLLFRKNKLAPKLYRLDNHANPSPHHP